MARYRCSQQKFKNRDFFTQNCQYLSYIFLDPMLPRMTFVLQNSHSSGSIVGYRDFGSNEYIPIHLHIAFDTDYQSQRIRQIYQYPAHQHNLYFRRSNLNVKKRLCQRFWIFQVFMLNVRQYFWLNNLRSIPFIK